PRSVAILPFLGLAIEYPLGSGKTKLYDDGAGVGDYSAWGGGDISSNSQLGFDLYTFHLRAIRNTLRIVSSQRPSCGHRRPDRRIVYNTPVQLGMWIAFWVDYSMLPQ